MKSDIQHITVKGIANYSDALEFAFREFQKVRMYGLCLILLLLFLRSQADFINFFFRGLRLT